MSRAKDYPGAWVGSLERMALSTLGDRGVLPGSPERRVTWAQVHAKRLLPRLELGRPQPEHIPIWAVLLVPTTGSRRSKRRPLAGRNALVGLRGHVAGGGRSADLAGFRDRVPRLASDVAAAVCVCMCVPAAHARRTPQGSQMRPCADHAALGPPQQMRLRRPLLTHLRASGPQKGGKGWKRREPSRPRILSVVAMPPLLNPSGVRLDSKSALI